MSVNWITAYNRLFKIINTGGDCYYSGPAFIQVAQQVDDSIPSYSQFIEVRNQHRKSTSRNDFYWDIINSLGEPQKYELFSIFIEALEPYVKEEIEGIRSVVFGGGFSVPTTVIPQKLWSSEKLNLSLKEIDKAIDAQQFSRAVTLAYTCLEGLYKAYVRENIPDQMQAASLISLSKLVKNDISES